MDKMLRLQELVGQSQVIRVTPKHRPDDKYYGVPLAVSDEFLLLHEIRDFHFDGFLVLPLKNIRGVRHKDAEQTMNRILTAEGVLAKAGMKDPISIASAFDLFKSLKAAGKLISVEAYEPESSGRWVQDYYLIGKISGMSRRNMAILPFDALGRWETEPLVVPYKRVLTVTFDNEYANIFAKYVK